MDALVIGSDPALKATFHSKRYGSDGWLDSYAIDLEAIDFRASVRVQNPGYGHPPTQLFNEMATHWKGWKDRKFWGALDGELEIEATTDATGHVTLKVTIPGYENTQLWSAHGKLLIEGSMSFRVERDSFN